MNKTDCLYVVVPCYNEEEVLPETASRLKVKLQAMMDAGQIAANSRVLFVDDGSKDKTWQLIEALAAEDTLFAGAKLSRNKGHQNALLAGLTAACQHGDMIISIDADLQDDIEVFDQFVEKYYAGAQIVYGVRNDRTTDSFFKRSTAQGFYKFMRLMGAEVVNDHADYRLMSARAVKELLEFKEVHLFLRGMVPLLGFKTDTVQYKRGQRFAGESKYPLKKMLAFAINGITSFSVKPLRFITSVGAVIFAGSVIALLWLLWQKLFGHTVEGWATVMGSIWLLGGIQLLSVGILGEYLGKIYMESKRRPPFIIERLLLKP